MTLHIDSFIFRVDATDLQSTAKRYTSRFGSKDGLTLVFAHCVGSQNATPLDKEQWEPTIEQIFRLQQSKNRRDPIREAWAFDWQSHGDAAVINAGVLNSRNEANHGLQALSTSDGEAVGLKTDKRQEGMTYPQFAPYIESVTLFRERCMIIPFHIIFGEKIDFM
ncbi:hypothetical protein C0989_006437 [Termitomyces sp. Mn162]|nr:hypothetical protein C0989_006437 [Termitomyces sp. Mn162]